MKIALSTSGESGLDSSLDPRFGRAAAFIIVDPESGNFEIIDNKQNLNAAQGAGIQSAQNVASSEAKVLITGHCGPKAFRALKTAGFRIYYTQADNVNHALSEYQQGKLQEAGSADVEGHW